MPALLIHGKVISMSPVGRDITIYHMYLYGKEIQCSHKFVRERMAFIDALRGLVIVLMALDHVRDFFGMTPFSPTDLAQTTPAWFATRYITHFCAPIFVFLAGCSAWLYGQTVTRPELSRFLLTRGVWLILLEATFIS